MALENLHQTRRLNLQEYSNEKKASTMVCDTRGRE
jgi:hypothetical protein